MQKITPFLWFDNQAEEAVRTYKAIFSDASIGEITHYCEGGPGPGPVGSVMTIRFSLNGMDFVALNGGPEYKINEAVSFIVDCETQEEIDHYWEKLSEGGKTSQCGWLTDRFGVTWQIVPPLLTQLLENTDEAKSRRVMESMMKMTKIVIADLQKAAEG